MAKVSIAEDQIAAYEKDGVVCLRGAFDPAWIARAAEGVEADIAEPGPLHTIQVTEGEAGFFLTDFCMAQRIEAFRDFVLDSPAGEIAATLMGSAKANFFYDAIWIKEQGTPKRTRWHQDQPYYAVDGRQFCAIWTPLDPVPKETCLELIRGSHHWGRWFQPELTRDSRDLYPENDAFERMPDIEGARSDYDIVAWDMEPGDCIVFQAMVVHGAPGNTSATLRRRALSTFWLGDDATYAERPGRVRPDFIGHGLKPGDPMDSGYFPRVWPSESGLDTCPRFTDPGLRITA
ncbi:MAG: phytanoyl-CoA dioxygenase family protein [Proteobacteria bacterium]|nr:phytanoyl-CoA dioxygenase family protein [Pseudomonadota bacterium]